MLNLIIALNLDTFSSSEEQEDRTRLFEGAMKWIDPILAPSSSRTRWEEATRLAMNEALEQLSERELPSDINDNWGKGGFLSSQWSQSHGGKENYWRDFIPKGIYMAAKLRLEAKLPGRKMDVKP